ncbi:androgen-dependent TFPI-regulating protein-like isoform X1 [Periplaneta americana]|uniref:androgen-dependent TFPI-regulating protein-like isoform X1 n=2 Tax=Periplaneta americana TaxID=6978 RepID=UPI0037E77AEB
MSVNGDVCCSALVRRIMFVTLFHAATLLHHLVVVGFCILFIPLDNDNQFVWEAKHFYGRYFTNWNFAFQILYFTMCVVADMLDEKSKVNLKSWLEDAKNFLFTVIVFPYTWFSVTSFWTMYHVDEEYVFPQALKDLCPPWVNHGVHTNILVVMLLEVVLSPRLLVMSRMKGAVVLAISLVAYDITYLSGNILYGAYLYPFCTWFYTSEMVMILIGFNIWIMCFYILGAKFVFTSNIKPQKTRLL